LCPAARGVVYTCAQLSPGIRLKVSRENKVPSRGRGALPRHQIRSDNLLDHGSRELDRFFYVMTPLVINYRHVQLTAINNGFETAHDNVYIRYTRTVTPLETIKSDGGPTVITVQKMETL